MKTLENWKTTLSVLWLLHGIGGVSFLVLQILELGVVPTQFGPFKIDSTFLLLIIITQLVALLMAFLSQTLGDNSNRWLNIIVAAVMAIFPLLILADTLKNPSVLAINPLFGIVWSVLIIWVAWKSKQKT